VAGVFVCSATLFGLIGAPSPYLLAGVLSGAVRALTAHRATSVPGPVRTGALAVVGVAAGSAVRADVVGQVVRQPWAILGGCVATLALTLAAGQLLRLSRAVDGNTAVLASIAGGASGLTVMARDLDADEGIVAAVQYLRVLVVIVTVPVVAPMLGHGQTPVTGVVSGAGSVGWSVLFTAVALTVGLGLARLLTFPGAGLLLPLTVAAGLSWWGVIPDSMVPPLLLNATYAVIGLMVGLNLSAAALRRIAAVLPHAVGMLIISLGGCAAIGIGLSHLVGVSAFSGYLAFTPGGLPAVIAVAVDAGADTEFVVSCQVIRLVLALFAAAAIGALVRRRSARRR